MFAAERVEAGTRIAASARVLDEISVSLARVRADLLHDPVLFYFHSTDGRTALPRLLVPLLGALEDGRHASEDAEVRLARAAALETLADYADLVATDFLGVRGMRTADALAAYRGEHEAPGSRGEVDPEGAPREPGDAPTGGAVR